MKWRQAVTVGTLALAAFAGRAAAGSNADEYSPRRSSRYTRVCCTRLTLPPTEPHLPSISTLAVLPIHGGEKGHLATESLYNQLQQGRSDITIVDDRTVERARAELNFTLEDLHDPRKAASLGRRVGAQVVVSGVVGDYWSSVSEEPREIRPRSFDRLGVGQHPPVPRHGTSWVCTADLNVSIRLIDSDSARVLTISDRTASTRLELDHEPGIFDRGDLLKQVVDVATREFLAKFRTHTENRCTMVDSSVGTYEVELLSRALTRGRLESAIQLATAQLTELRSTKAPRARVAAALYNLGAVREFGGEAEAALAMLTEAIGMYEYHPEELPIFYRQAEARLRHMIDPAQSQATSQTPVSK